MIPEHNKEDYDAEPVAYCSRCYSLKIKYEEAIDADCCMDCGSTEISTGTIEEWEKLYENRYGHKFIQASGSPRGSVYFKMSIEELKNRLYRSDCFYSILYKLYPRFPRGFTKTEAIILLFDKLSKDSRMDDLRYAMYDYSRKNKFSTK